MKTSYTAGLALVCLSLIVCLGATTVAGAQTAVQTAAVAAGTVKPFDVVSIKASDPNVSGYSFGPSANGFNMRGGTLRFMITLAYELHDFQLANAPGWISGARFDLAAKMDSSSSATPPGSSTSGQGGSGMEVTEARLRAILADRFNLRVHTSTKEMPVYALVVAKGGPKLKASTSNTGYSTGTGHYTCSDASMEDLADVLSGASERIVVDRTKLTGEYAFALKWAPEDSKNADASLPGLFTALEEQLGLKLVPARGPVEMLSIDHIEMPSAN